MNSDGKGNVWIDGGKATVKAFNENYWEATSGKNTVSISAKMTEIRTYPGLDLIVSTGFACRRIILIILQRKNRPTQVRLTPALLFKREAKLFTSPSLSAMDLKLNGIFKQALG